MTIGTMIALWETLMSVQRSQVKKEPNDMINMPVSDSAINEAKSQYVIETSWQGRLDSNQRYEGQSFVP